MLTPQHFSPRANARLESFLRHSRRSWGTVHTPASKALIAAPGDRATFPLHSNIGVKTGPIKGAVLLPEPTSLPLNYEEWRLRA